MSDEVAQEVIAFAQELHRAYHLALGKLPHTGIRIVHSWPAHAEISAVWDEIGLEGQAFFIQLAKELDMLPKQYVNLYPDDRILSHQLVASLIAWRGMSVEKDSLGVEHIARFDELSGRQKKIEQSLDRAGFRLVLVDDDWPALLLKEQKDSPFVGYF